MLGHLENRDKKAVLGVSSENFSLTYTYKRIYAGKDV